MTGALATRVLMQGTRATGVEYIKGIRETVRVNADREVILSGGAFNTPPLLMLSGIGPADHLRATGIKPVVDLPVGKNLQDHLAVIIFFERLNESIFRHDMRFDRMAVSMLRAYFFGTGPGTMVPGGLHAFVKTRPELAVPDIEFMFRGAPADPSVVSGIRPAYADGYGIRPTLLHPDSRGEILLRSSDPRDPPRIAYNFFSAPNDLPRLREGFKRAREVGYQAPIKEHFVAADLSPPATRSRPTPRSMPSFAGPRSRRIIPAAPAPWGRRRTPSRIRSCGCAASSTCAWSTPPSCLISSQRISTLAF